MAPIIYVYGKRSDLWYELTREDIIEDIMSDSDGTLLIEYLKSVSSLEEVGPIVFKLSNLWI